MFDEDITKQEQSNIKINLLIALLLFRGKVLLLIMRIIVPIT